jgi:hypothetical protein
MKGQQSDDSNKFPGHEEEKKKRGWTGDEELNEPVEIKVDRLENGELKH